MNDNLVWIRFDESDRYSPAPNFCIPAVPDDEVCRDDYRGNCNLVLVFGHSSSQDNIQLLESFADRLNDYKDANTCVLLITREPVEGVGLSSEIIITSSKFIRLLSDKRGEVRRSYADLLDESLVRENDVLVFILDMYGAPYYALSRKEINHPGFHHETIKWLEFIGMQCPE